MRSPPPLAGGGEWETASEDEVTPGDDCAIDVDVENGVHIVKGGTGNDLIDGGDSDTINGGRSLPLKGVLAFAAAQRVVVGAADQQVVVDAAVDEVAGCWAVFKGCAAARRLALRGVPQSMVRAAPIG